MQLSGTALRLQITSRRSAKAGLRYGLLSSLSQAYVRCEHRCIIKLGTIESVGSIQNL